MVSTPEGLIYYSAVFLTALVSLTEASAIATNYDKSSASVTTNQTHEPHDLPHRTKLVPRSRSITSGTSSSRYQSYDRLPLNTITKLTSSQVEASKSANELLLVSNSGGENEVKDKGGGGASGSGSDDDDQKTLSEQVADGKYALIQNEIFTSRPQRPGLLSYDVNPEVPKDNINNLGGLEPDDIWLAENHLLVLAGSSLSSMQSQWTPIDNYVAPRRPVKLPPNPKVPPPFPVQLSENGPIEYIGSAATPTRPAQTFGFYNPLFMHYPHFANGSHGYAPSLYDSNGSYGSPMRPPFKPSPPASSVLVKPPPGAEFIPPYLRVNHNQSEPLDEDDPTLYYPPPYDFFYPRDNTSRVPPGPLVPGIVLSPPPDFFSSFSNQTILKVPKPVVTIENPFKQTVYKVAKQLQHVRPDLSADTPTRAPFIPYNDIINDVTYPSTDRSPFSNLKPSQVNPEDTVQGWVPIPAPHPYYITGPQKPIQNTVLVMTMDASPHGYNYQPPQTPLNIPKKRPSVKFLQYLHNSQPFPSTTPLVSQIASTAQPPSTTVHSTTPVTAQYDQPTIKATYYFYEEPKFIDTDRPTSIVSTTATPITTSTAAPTPTQPPSVHPLLVEKKPHKHAPMIPIYYLAELNNIYGDLLNPNLPSADFYSTTFPTNNKPSYDRPTPKPILEYSYVAADYNSANSSPRPPSTTPAPASLYNAAPHYHIDYNTFYRPASQLYPIYNPPSYYQAKVPVAAAPFYSQPWLPNPYNPISYPTESPFYAFFTKEDEDLIDDNTKKYFSLFGQKLKYDLESTSPLPGTQAAASSTTSSAGWNPNYYPSQSTTTTTTSSTANYASLSSTPSPTYQKPTSTPSYYPTTPKPPSLEGDTRVNYVTPLPPTNPDAEYLPSKISKHIRPIVVEDLPADIHERLRNIMNLNHQPHHHHHLHNKLTSSVKGNSQFRYTLHNNLHRPQQSSLSHYSTYNPYDTQPSTPASLHTDVRVNYKQRHKLVTNPDAEYISSEERIRSQQPIASKESSAESLESSTSKPVSLADDILVNYRGQHNRNPHAEYIGDTRGYPRSASPASSTNTNVVSYKYPSVDRGHFYFVTPHETHLGDIEDERYDSHSDVEKPSTYFKRQREYEHLSTTSKPARAA